MQQRGPVGPLVRGRSPGARPQSPRVAVSQAILGSGARPAPQLCDGHRPGCRRLPAGRDRRGSRALRRHYVPPAALGCIAPPVEKLDLRHAVRPGLRPLVGNLRRAAGRAEKRKSRAAIPDGRLCFRPAPGRGRLAVGQHSKRRSAGGSGRIAEGARSGSASRYFVERALQ